MNIFFCFLHAISCPKYTIPKQSSIVHYAIVAEDDLFWFNIVTSQRLNCDASGIAVSYSSIVLARAYWRKGDPHKSITTVSIDFSPPGIHGLAFKKVSFISRMLLGRVLSSFKNLSKMGMDLSEVEINISKAGSIRRGWGWNTKIVLWYLHSFCIPHIMCILSV